MKIVTIDSENSSVLYRKAKVVKLPLSAEVKKQIETMRVFYKSFKDKSGFAAPQVGYSDQIILVEQHLFDTTITMETDEPAILINPRWRPLDNKKELDFEGCLSVPGKMGIVERYINVELTAWLYDRDHDDLAKIQREYRREFSSVLWQHEIDHLHGDLYIDKAKVVLVETEFLALRQALMEAGKLHNEMTLFDVGPLLYQLVQECPQESAKQTAPLDQQCPCGSQQTFEDCCGLYISGGQPATTPETLMRSRYSAYTRANIPYIQKTMCGAACEGFDVNKAQLWAEQADWLGLTVINVSMENCQKGYVEFIAQYAINEQECQIHERSEFHYIDGLWYYVNGEMP